MPRDGKNISAISLRLKYCFFKSSLFMPIKLAILAILPSFRVLKPIGWNDALNSCATSSFKDEVIIKLSLKKS